VDLGVLHQFPATPWFPNVRAGLSVRRWGAGFKYETETLTLPREIRFSAASECFADQIRVVADLARLREGRTTLQTGVEYAAGGPALFRLGYSSALDDGPGLSYGFGVRLWDVQLDYAHGPMRDLADAHWMGLSWRFGGVAEKSFERGMDYFRQGDDANAVVWFGRALAADPKHARALIRLRQANARLEETWKDLPPSP
jgi:hypothetical protein